MPTPALNVAIRADTSKFKSDMESTSAIAHMAIGRITRSVVEMNSGWLASQGVAGAATLAFGNLLGVLGPIALGVTTVKNSFQLLDYAIDLSKKQVAEFSELADKASSSGFDAEFFQRITKSSGEAREKIDGLSDALIKFNEASAYKLGGSDLQNRIDELKNNGNLSNNTGVAAFATAGDAEARLRAIVSLINQMMDAGERLAALDLAGKAFGPQITAALRDNSGYLDAMLKRADALSKTKIVSDEDLGRAVDLKERLEAAQKVLADKWKPVQDDLAKMGMTYHESWVSITEDLAAAVGYATQLYMALKQVPDWFANRIGNASIWNAITNATTTPESRAASEASLGISSDPAAIGMVAANAKLRLALQNHANISKGMREATDVQSIVRGDTSKKPTDDKTAEKNEFDRTSEAIAKHTARMEADAQTVGKGSAAIEELRAESQLLTAAQQAGLPVTEAMRNKIQKLAQEAGDAASALAKAKVASDISVGKQTALLSPEDAAIARELASIYGDDVPRALASSEAAALRFNNALREAGTLGQDVTRGVFTDFVKQIHNGASAMDALKNAGMNALDKLADKLASMAADNLWQNAFGGGSLFGLSSATAGATWSSGLGAGTGGLSFPMFASGTDNAPGGLAIVGEKGPELVNLPRGSQVVPNHQIGSAMSGDTITAPVTVNIDATGADAAGLRRVEQQVADLKANLPMLTVQAVRNAKNRRLL